MADTPRDAFLIFLFLFSTKYDIICNVMLEYIKRFRRENSRGFLIAVMAGIAVIMAIALAICMLAEHRANTRLIESANATTAQAVSYEATETEAAQTTQTTQKENKKDALLVLVNYNHPLDKNYKPELVKTEENHEIDKRAKGALDEMLKAARAAGCRPYLTSAYRSKEYQTKLFNRKVNEYKRAGMTQKDAEKEASGWVAVPGTSEHHLGLAVDIVDRNNKVLDERQENTKTQKWLMENSWKYGFILRYPNDKKDITHINYEPWHYRYVGRKNAKLIKESGLCLEEYLEKNK